MGLFAKGRNRRSPLKPAPRAGNDFADWECSLSPVDREVREELAEVDCLATSIY